MVEWKCWIRGTGVEFMPEGISDIGDNEDIDSIVKKYRTETEIGSMLVLE